MKHKLLYQNIKQYLVSQLFGASRSKRWKKAQLGEFEWWREIAGKGYNGRTRDEFVSVSQRGWMLSQLKFLEKPFDSWKDGIIVEFGSGPAGFVEYIEAKQKIAIEPLIDHYRKVFPHLAKSNVEYWNCPAEDVGHLLDNIADLVICFNVLDHTRDPNRVIQNLARAAKTGADLLFQVNVYLSDEQIRKKFKKHAEIHPHSFFPETILSMLRMNRFDIRKQQLSEELDVNGECFFICAGVKI